MEWEAQLLEARIREQQGARWAAAEGYSEADFSGVVRRLRQSPLRRAVPDSAAPGDRWWKRCVITLAGHWTCEAYGLRANVVAQEYHLPD